MPTIRGHLLVKGGQLGLFGPPTIGGGSRTVHVKAHVRHGEHGLELVDAHERTIRAKPPEAHGAPKVPATPPPQATAAPTTPKPSPEYLRHEAARNLSDHELHRAVVDAPAEERPTLQAEYKARLELYAAQYHGLTDAELFEHTEKGGPIREQAAATELATRETLKHMGPLPGPGAAGDQGKPAGKVGAGRLIPKPPPPPMPMKGGDKPTAAWHRAMAFWHHGQGHELAAQVHDYAAEDHDRATRAAQRSGPESTEARAAAADAVKSSYEADRETRRALPHEPTPNEVKAAEHEALRKLHATAMGRDDLTDEAYLAHEAAGKANARAAHAWTEGRLDAPDLAVRAKGLSRRAQALEQSTATGPTETHTAPAHVRAWLRIAQSDAREGNADDEITEVAKALKVTDKGYELPASLSHLMPAFLEYALGAAQEHRRELETDNRTRRKTSDPSGLMVPESREIDFHRQAERHPDRPR